MTEIDRKIALELVRAQASSDAGKDIDRIRGHKVRRSKYLGYKYKTMAIKRAIDLINGSKESMFRYYVVTSNDQNGYPSVITYVAFKHDGVRYQISYHTPMNQADMLLPFVGKGRVMRWDKKKSFNTAKVLTSLIRGVWTTV